MTTTHRLVRIVSCAVFAIAVAGAAVLADPAPTGYRIENLGTLGAPDGCENGEFPTWSVAYGLNEAGHVAGWAERSDALLDPDTGEPLVYPDTGLPVCHRWGQAVLWKDGEAIALGSLSDHTESFAMGVNAHDEVVGWAMKANSSGSGYHGHPFLWTEDGGMIDSAPDALGGQSWGINDFGEIVMDLWGSAGGAYFRDRDGALRKIGFGEDPRGGPTDTAWEINNDGVVVGASDNPDAGGLFHAYRYDSKSDAIENVHDPFFTVSEAYGLNENGDAVGWTFASAPFPSQFGFVAPTEGEPLVLPVGDMIFDGKLRWDVFVGQAEHMNDRGDVVGTDRGIFVDPIAWVAFDVLGGGPVEKIPLWELLGPEDREQWEPLSAWEINESRQIIGVGLWAGRLRAYRMTPDATVSGREPADGDVDSDTSVGARPARAGEGDRTLPETLRLKRDIVSARLQTSTVPLPSTGLRHVQPVSEGEGIGSRILPGIPRPIPRHTESEGQTEPFDRRPDLKQNPRQTGSDRVSEPIARDDG